MTICLEDAESPYNPGTDSCYGYKGNSISQTRIQLPTRTELRDIFRSSEIIPRILPWRYSSPVYFQLILFDEQMVLSLVIHHADTFGFRQT